MVESSEQNETTAPPAYQCPQPDQRPELWPWGTQRNSRGELEIASLSATRIARDYGSPIYVLNETDLAHRANLWATVMAEEFWPGYGMGGGSAYYAAKALLSSDIARIVSDAGMGLDTASYGELTCALRAGVDPEKIGLHGNNKPADALAAAITAGERGIARIVIDAPTEVERIAQVAAASGRTARVMVRVTTGVHAGGHDFIATAHEDQKFGLSLNSGQALQVVREAAANPHLEFVGLHAHIGSQIFDLAAFFQSASKLMELAAQLKAEGIDCREVDLGGGYAVAYTNADPTAPSPQSVARTLATAVRQACTKFDLEIPHVSIEPGRSVVAPTVVTLYQVGTVKSVPISEGHERLYVSVDGGMSDNIRPALYQADYTATLANRVSDQPLVRARVVGQHCESGDIVVRNVDLPSDIQAGDLLVVPVTGAYGHVMSSNYNLLTRPGTLAVKDGQARWLLRPETIDDILARDTGLTPDHHNNNASPTTGNPRPEHPRSIES